MNSYCVCLVKNHNILLKFLPSVKEMKKDGEGGDKIHPITNSIIPPKEIEDLLLFSFQKRSNNMNRDKKIKKVSVV